ncbi:PAS domain-containing protein [Nioella nitratireducens]|uniref:PAS domain-containing protein n=1 Tax=Nioella nitratireducens TaxID=1287720 RepID=UPI0008FD1EBA|nr:PAS domain-containing protein [Nioella nitratireducens]
MHPTIARPATETIVPLWPRQPPGPCQTAAALHAYWQGLRTGDALPRRRDVDPRALGPLLPYAFLIDRVRPQTLRVRLGGRHLTDLMGMDLRGMPLRALFDSPDRAQLVDMADRVFSTPAGLEAGLISESQCGAVLTGRMVILPLVGRSGAVDRAIGVLSTTGTIGLTPRRFRLCHTSLKPFQTQPTGPRPVRTPAFDVIRGGRA